MAYQFKSHWLKHSFVREAVGSDLASGLYTTPVLWWLTVNGQFCKYP